MKSEMDWCLELKSGEGSGNTEGIGLHEEAPRKWNGKRQTAS
jgi:hypothetical protein